MAESTGAIPKNRKKSPKPDKEQKSPVKKIVSSTKVLFRRSPSSYVYNIEDDGKSPEKHAGKYSLNPEGSSSPTRALFRDEGERAAPTGLPAGSSQSENPQPKSENLQAHCQPENWSENLHGHRQSKNSHPLAHYQPANPPAHYQPENPPAHYQPANPPAHYQPANPPAHYQPANPPAHYQPANPPAHYQPENPPAHYQPENPLAHYQPENPLAHYQPENPPAHYQPENPPVHYQPANPPAHYQPANPPAHYQPENPPAHYQPENPPAHYQPENPLAHYQPENSLAHYQPENPPAHYQPENPPVHYQPANPPAHYQPANPPAHYQPANPPAHYQPANPPAHYQPANPPAHYQPANPTAHYQPANPPAHYQLANPPAHCQSETPHAHCQSQNPHAHCQSNLGILESPPEYHADSDNSATHDDVCDYSVGHVYYRLCCKPLDCNVFLYLQSIPPVCYPEIPTEMAQQNIQEYLHHVKNSQCGKAMSLSRSPKKSPPKSPQKSPLKSPKKSPQKSSKMSPSKSPKKSPPNYSQKSPKKHGKVSPGKAVKNIMKVIPKKHRYTISISPSKDREQPKSTEAKETSPDASNFKYRRLSPEYIEKLATSPQASENKRTTPLDRAEMQYPICYKFEEKDVLKKECIYLRDPTRIYRMVFAKLLRNGTLFIYRTEYAVPERNPVYAYDVKNCEAKKREKNTRFRLYVNDVVSKTCLYIQADTEKMRDKWIDALTSFKNHMLLVEPASAFSKLEQQLEDINMPFSMQSYQILRCFGRGSFGKVFICKNIEKDRSYYAMKIMRKDVIVDKEGVFALEAEIASLRSYNVRCVQEMTFCYIDRDFVVFGMPLASGGSLAHHVQNNHNHSLKIATYYGVFIAAALMYLHSKNIIHRALNLHAVYLDREGRLKVSDFGICIYCLDNKRFNKHIGQHPCYVAPELLKGDPYSFSVDWWAYGICFYTMVTGLEPFMREEYQGEADNEKYYNAILDSVLEENIDFSNSCFSEEAADYLQQILEKDPLKRLACQGNEKEVATHSIFTEIAKQIISTNDEPPIKPEFVEGEDDPAIFIDTLLGAEEAVNITPPRKGALMTIRCNESLDQVVWDRHYRTQSPSPASSTVTILDLDYKTKL